MSEYPKLMWSPIGVEVTVTAPDEEAALKEQGYRYTKEAKPKPPAKADGADADVPPDESDGEGPTFGPPDDDTHVKRAAKKK